jgi:dipeptidyl-peptidase-4
MKSYRYLGSICVLAMLWLIPQIAHTQNITKKDYSRAVNFLWENLNNKKVFNTHVATHWFEDDSGFWYLIHAPEKKTFMGMKFNKKGPEVLFNHTKVAAALSTLLDTDVAPEALPFNTIERVQHGIADVTIKAKHYTIDLSTGKVEEQVKQKEVNNPFETSSPNGNWVAFTKEYNLYVKDSKSDIEIQLTTDGEQHRQYGSWYGWYDKMEGENGERPRRFSVRWSEDSRYITTDLVDTRNAEKMYLLDWSIDSLYKPKLLSYYRGSPGDTNMVRLTPKIFDMETRKEVKTNLPSNTHINSVSLSWPEKPNTLYVDYPERGYQKVHVGKIRLPEGTMEELLVETSTTNIDQFQYHILEKQGIMIFMSERSGWKQLYKLDLATKQISPLTNGNYFINEIRHIDRSKGMIYYMASGKEEGNNPYHQQLYRVDLDGKVRLLTPELYHHSVELHPEKPYFVDNYSTATTSTRTVFRSLKNGKIICELSKADMTALEAMNWKAPRVFEVVARDEKTPLYGALWLPSNFDPSRKYPLIDHSYTGPHTQMFPKDFRRVLSLNNQALAELGFIVMMVDGMGTTGRSKAFRNVSYKNMGKNLTDHKLAIEQLAERHEWIDSDKVGIYGHSAGGYDAAHALLEFPEFYKVAVSSSADHDFRMEKAWWPEMYMGWPVDEKYHEVSNITMAPKLKGKLLLVHGGLDDNVNPSATFKLAEALVKADKEFDLLILPSQRHGYQGKFSKYFLKKRWNYFVEHLLGQQPIWEFSWK